MDEIGIKISADASGVKNQTDSAKNAINGMATSARADAQAMAAEFAKLNVSLAAMQVQLAQVSEATRNLSSYADWAFYLGIVKTGWDGIKGAVVLAGDATETVLNGSLTLAQYLGQKTREGAQSWIQYAESLAYAKVNGLNLRVEGDGLTSMIGRLSLAVREWLTEMSLYGSKTLEGERAAMAFNGSLRRLSETAGESGFNTATDALVNFTTILMRVPGMTEQTAASIQSSFSAIPNYSAPLNQELVNIVAVLGTSEEAAKKWGDALTTVMRDPLANGKQYLDTLGGVDRAYYEQIDRAKEQNNVGQAQIAVLNAVLSRMKELASERKNATEDDKKSWATWGSIGNTIYNIKEYFQQKEVLARRIEETAQQFESTNQRIGTQLASQLQTLEQQHRKIQEIITSESSYATQLETVNSKIQTLRAGLRGSTDDAARMIQEFEKFRAKAYWDESPGSPEKSHWAVGYGAHTLGGQEVTKDTTVTSQQAFEDLKDKIATIQDQLAAKIGESWDSISAKAKASMTSMAYNYGIGSSALKPMIDAARAGNEPGVAAAILARQNDNEGVNRSRRQQEAANITGSPELSDAEQKRASEAMDKLLDQQQRLNDAKNGGNAVEKATVDNMERVLQGDRDEVAAQERIVTAAQERLRQAHSAEEVAARTRELDQAQLTLDEKRFAVKQAEANLKISRADTPQETRDAKVEKAQLTMNRYSADTAQYKAALQEKEAAETEFKAAVQKDDADTEEVRYRNALRGLEQRKVVLQEEQQTGQITKQQMFAGELALENERTQLERTHLEKLKEIWDEGSKQYRAAKRKLEEEDQASALRRQQIERQVNASIRQDYQSVFNTLTSTMSSSIMGMIQGTSKFKDMLRALTLDVIKMFVDAGLKMVANWAASMAQKIVLSVTGEAEITAANAAGLAARTAANATAAASDLAMKVASVVKSIMSSAAETFAGIFGFMSPLMGPAAAGPAAAGMATVAGMASVASFDVGAWNIPQDQLAMVHQGELIMTASQGNAFRTALNGMSGSNGGGGDGDVHHHYHFAPNVSTVDGASVSSWFRNNERHIMRAMGEMVRNGAHLGVKGVG